MNDQLTLTLPSALFRDLAFFSTENTDNIDEETMNELKQKLDQLLAGQAELKAQRATEMSASSGQNSDLTQTINRLFTMIKRDYNNRQAMASFNIDNQPRNHPPFSGEIWRAKFKLKRPSDLPLDQSGSGFYANFPLPERLNGKKGSVRYFEDKPEIDLTGYWNTWDFTAEPVNNPFQYWTQGFAENETERTFYLVFYAYPEIESLDDLEWEEVTVE